MTQYQFRVFRGCFHPLLPPDPAVGDYDMIRHTGLLVEANRLVIFYSSLPGPGGGEEIKVALFDLSAPDWLRWGPLRRLGTVLWPELPWETNDVRDPFPLLYGDTLYLYYVGGHEYGVGLAKVQRDALDRLR